MNEELREFLRSRHEHTVFKTLGIEIEKIDSSCTILRLKIDDRHRQHLGMVHGGIFVLLAESAASIAAACLLRDPLQSVVGLEINSNHIKSVRDGGLKAQATRIHAGKKSAVYEARITDDENNLISIARCTLLFVEQRRP